MPSLTPRHTLYPYALCLVLAANVSAQSSSDSTFSIQTSPPDPFGESGISGSGAGTPLSTGSASRTGSSAATSSTTSSPAGFPQQCAKECEVVVSALNRCNPSFIFNATCLCTTDIEVGYLQCVECALVQSGSHDIATFQALIDAYIDQCQSAPFSATTLPNVTVTIPPSSSASNGSASRTSSSMSMTSSSMSRSSSSVASSAAASASQTSGAALPGAEFRLVGFGWAGLWMATMVLGAVVLVL